MEEPFDPYRKWLGIPPEEQPPHHYRLLGVAVFEDDPDVISNAADRQMAHLRTFQTGKRGAQSQALLNQVGVAKVCLLNADTKRAYDQKLRAKLVARPVAPAAAPPLAAVRPVPVRAVPIAGVPIPPEESDDFSTGLPGAGIPRLRKTAAAPSTAFDEAPFQDTVFEKVTLADDDVEEAESAAASASLPQLRGRPRRRSQSTSAAAVIGGIGAVIVVGGIAAAMLSGDRNADKSAPPKNTPRETTVAPGEKNETKTTPISVAPPDRPKPPATANSKKPSTVTDVSKSETLRPLPPGDKPAGDRAPGDKPADVPGPKDTAKPTDTAKPKTPEKKPSDTVGSKKPATDAPNAGASDHPATETPAVVAKPKRPAPPAKEAIDKAYRIVRKEFSQRLAEAHLMEERSEVAQEISQKISESSDPATRYALVLLKRNLALQMADVDAACRAIDLLAESYDVDAFAMKREAIEEASTFVTLALDDQQDLMVLLVQLARQAMSEEKSDAAVGLARVAKGISNRQGMRLAKTYKEAPELEDVIKEVDAIAADATEFDRDLKGFERATKQLARDANDGVSNLMAARYWAFVKHDWAKAMAHFAKCNDPMWKEPATIDATEPKEPAAQVALADQWLATAKRKGGIAKEPTMRRALTWYERAIPKLPDTARSAAQAKVSEINAALARAAASAAGVRKADTAKDAPLGDEPVGDKPDGTKEKKGAMEKKTNGDLAPDGSALDKTMTGDSIPPSERKPVDEGDPELETPDELE